MCQLLGVVEKTQTDLNDLLREFYKRGRYQKHGWGLVKLTPEHSKIIKSPEQATKSAELEAILEKGVVAQNLFAHLRYATVGEVEPHNVHPFSRVDATGRQWVMMHQGTIYDYPILDKYKAVQEGTTDSERILLYLMDQINEATQEQGRPLNAEERFSLLEKEIIKMAPGQNKVILAIYDGEQIYIHTNCQDYMSWCQEEDRILFSTKPLEEVGELWEDVPLNTLFLLKDGKIVRRGTTHDGIYFETDEDRRITAAIYAELEGY